MILLPLVLALATPAPQPTLKEIGRVHSSAFCTALSKNVKPYVFGLMRNDELIYAGEATFALMGKDVTLRNQSGVQLGQARAARIVLGLGKNLEIMDKLVKNVPPAIRTEDDRELVELKNELGRLAESQRLTLDAISGVLDTAELGQMQSEKDHNMENASQAKPSPSAGRISDPDYAGDVDQTYISAAGLPQYSSIPNYVDVRKLIDSNVIGQTVYGKLASESRTASATRLYEENLASRKIVSAAASCGGGPTPELSTPVPNSTPFPINLKL